MYVGVSEATFNKTKGLMLLWFLDLQTLSRSASSKLQYALNNLKFVSIRQETWRSSASLRVSSHLLRDGRELVGSLKCHMHQLSRQGDGALSRKLNCTLVTMCVRVHV